ILLTQEFPNIRWEFSGSTLAANSLAIKDAEALGPSRLTPADSQTNPRFGQSLFLQYNVTAGGVPARVNLHWLQFLTTVNWNNQPGTIDQIDNDQAATPFYDGAFTADGTGFSDIPAQRIVAPLLPVTFRADLFLVEDYVLPGGGLKEVIWQGVRWGWTTAQAAPRVAAINPNAGADAGGYAVTITGDSFTGATNVSFGGV